MAQAATRFEWVRSVTSIVRSTLLVRLVSFFSKCTFAREREAVSGRLGVLLKLSTTFARLDVECNSHKKSGQY